MVVAKPRPPGVERGDERVRVLELLQDPLRARAAGEDVGQRPADPLEHRGAQQQLAHLRRLALQHLRQQIARHGALAAGELGDEPLGIGMAGERDRGQPQAGGPALGPLVQQRRRPRPRARSRSPRSSSRVSSSEKRRSGARISVSSPASRRRCSPSCGSSRVASTTRSVAAAARPRKRSSQPQRLGASAARAGRRSPARRGSSSARRSDSSRSTTASPRNAGVGADPLHEPVLAGRAGERVDHRQPEALRVPLAALDRDPGDPVGQVLATSTQERSSTVLPLPAGAQTSTTQLAGAADSRSNSASRAPAGSGSTALAPTRAGPDRRARCRYAPVRYPRSRDPGFDSSVASISARRRRRNGA